jgi:hypothetical protein
MQSYSKGDTFGEKLIPKVVKAVVQAVIATKKGLASTEVEIKHAAAHAIATTVGEEIAEITLPLVEEALENSKIPPHIQDIVRKMSDGQNQYQAIAGALLGATGSSGLLSAVMNNEFAPVIRRILSANPMLDPPWATIIQLVVRGLQDEETARGQIGGQGLNEGWINALQWLAQSIPDLPTLLEWLRRGLIDENTAKGWMVRNAIPEEVQNLYIDLARQLLSPQDMALAVLRGDTTLDYARQVANAAGITNDDFNILQLNTGEPPGLQQLLEAYRRDFIDKATLETGIRQSRVRDQWIPVIEQLRYEPIATADAIEAYVKGYITEDQAKSYTQQNGLEPDDFDALALSAGEPLSRTEMTMLWNRGEVSQEDVANAIRQSRIKDAYIDWALLLKTAPMSTADAIEAYVQGYLSKDNATRIIQMNGLRDEDIDPLMLTAGEPLPKVEMLKLWNRGLVTEDQVKDALRQSRLKDSYIDTALQLRIELPALYEVRALLANGSLTAEQGTQLLLESGYQTDIVKAIVAGATGEAVAGTKTLTAAQLSTLYQERELSATEYVNELVALGYSQTEAELFETLEDMKWSITARNQVITKIRAQYVGKKITSQQASADLDALQISASMRDQLLDDWNIELATVVKLLTEAQIVDAWQMNLFEHNDPAANTQLALNYLINLGYSSADAITLLEIKNKGPLGENAAQPTSSSGQNQRQNPATQSGNG